MPKMSMWVEVDGVPTLEELEKVMEYQRKLDDALRALKMKLTLNAKAAPASEADTAND
jgi:hypothetical protein